jgi:hypothetical protein
VPTIAHAGAPIVHHVTRAASPIKVVGYIDEVAWADAARLELGYEVQPGENITPPVRTVCLISYDESHV